MPRGNSVTQLDELKAALSQLDVEHEIEASPKAMRIKVNSRINYNVPGTDLAFPVAGPTEFVFNADGSLRSIDLKMKALKDVT